MSGKSKGLVSGKAGGLNTFIKLCLFGLFPSVDGLQRQTALYMAGRMAAGS